MSSQEQPLEKSENTFVFEEITEPNNFVDNAKKAIVYNDPLTLRPVMLHGSASMTMSMEDYAAVRVPADVRYNIVELQSSPDQVLPELNFQAYTDKSLNMFYRYLNAL